MTAAESARGEGEEKGLGSDGLVEIGQCFSSLNVHGYPGNLLKCRLNEGLGVDSVFLTSSQ